MNQEMLELLHRLLGLTVICPGGRRAGWVEDVFLAPGGTQPEWIGVRRSWISRRVTLVPLHEARVDGCEVYTPYSWLDVRDAPSYDQHQSLTMSNAQVLRGYWDSRVPDQP